MYDLFSKRFTLRTRPKQLENAPDAPVDYEKRFN